VRPLPIATAVQARTVTRIAEVDAAAWDRLAPADNPFLRHAFLHAMEASGSATEKTGWQPFHLAVEEDGRLTAAAPLYLKSHSYGEYVFDHGWAEGYRRAGGRYYPKLQAAVPFTPVPGPRLLAESDAARAVLVEGLKAVTAQLRLSSLHVTFCTAEETKALRSAGFLERRGVQYHWHNQGYGTFDDWLASLRSAKRKMVRKEREQVRAAGVAVEAVHGEAVTPALLDEFFPFYLATIDKRWGSAYLSRDFFRRLGRELKDAVVLMVARHRGRMVAGALNLRGASALYGRQWGCLEDFRFLHFEACYYQAIEFAIRYGLRRVEAGAQGAHKLHRGYAPVWTYSAHHIPHESFRDAVARFLAAERRALEDEMAGMEEALPYRQES
jgi:predicted N-acyltransferase